MLKKSKICQTSNQLCLFTLKSGLNQKTLTKLIENVFRTPLHDVAIISTGKSIRLVTSVIGPFLRWNALHIPLIKWIISRFFPLWHKFWTALIIKDLKIICTLIYRIVNKNRKISNIWRSLSFSPTHTTLLK